ncbi:YutD family protein [Paenibacillus sp. MMS20-IR301]|uniref:YutD family protein n=1 Tax=Paenibacillus sp. MMS20-IR301 TaxID=2895946 RepID=UPI0028E8BA95|nr:YutD family protein [Paenibacillus sp. MMS20-IR301]WNS43225.1 YutD family protein [Paenibacillus sp. MMS20-IR301]
MIVIGGKGYELMLDHKDGWNPEAFRGRYSEVLDRYDYIIGDWGYSQLRLKGFYRDNHPKVNRDTAISGMVDYINEYCNFGCAYFVLHKLKESPQEGTFKDILIKELPEPGLEEETEQAAAEPSANVKEHRETPAKGANREKDNANAPGREHPAKDRPVREHQSRNHRNKEGQGKKNHKEFQGRAQQSHQGNSHNHKSNHQGKQDNPNKHNNQNS